MRLEALVLSGVGWRGLKVRKATRKSGVLGQNAQDIGQKKSRAMVVRKVYQEGFA